MKKQLTIAMFILFICATVFSENIVQEYGDSFDNGSAEFRSSIDDSKEWFYDASLGLFLHWGIHSLMEKEPSWCMFERFMDRDYTFFHPKKYYSMAKKFDPQSYDPEKWMAAAKKAGFTYAVMTAKHHDGYALWPSEYGELDTGKFLDGRDLLKPYVEACRNNGLRVGFYFSGHDWYHKDFPRWTVRAPRQGLNYTYDGIDYSQWRRWDDDDASEVEKRLNRFYDDTKGQIRELLTNYGKIDILWFDGFPIEWPDSLKNHREIVNARMADIHKMIIDLQPNIVINNRAHGIDADFQTPERGDGSFMPDDYHLFHNDQWKRRWELCTVWASHWGYDADRIYRTSEWVIRMLALCRAKGGNFLLNSAPTPNGKQPAFFYKRCQEIAEWMEHSRVSVIGAGALDGDWKDHSNVPVTTADGAWYLHIFPNNRTSTIELKNIHKQPQRVILLRTGQQLEYHEDINGMQIILTEKNRSKLNDVVAVYWK